MSKLMAYLSIALLLFSCIGKHESDAQQAIISDKSFINEPHWKADTLNIDLNLSAIYWKGTKMRGAGKHEGKVQLKSGFFNVKNDRLISGEFIMAMETIEVSDIPEHETVPRNNLNNHLKSTDFFDVVKYPEAIFKITAIHCLYDHSLDVTGNLTIKDITKSIAFTGFHKNKHLSAKFTFDRFEWNIAYEGSWLEKTLVDKDIELSIDLFVE